ncbi:hypothetical protein BH09PAT1_BH09PAT1_8460 [soil metagenome]
MKKQVFGRQLKRDTNERKALFKGLVSSLIMYERIETTEEKAKSIKGLAEKIVTKAKKNNNAHARTLIQAYLTNEALQKMLTDIAPRFIDRPGGYTRILKIGNRFNDNASMVIMEWVEKSTKVKIVPAKKTAKNAGEAESTKVESSVEVAPKVAKTKKTVVSKTPAKKAIKKTTKKEVAK